MAFPCLDRSGTTADSSVPSGVYSSAGRKTCRSIIRQYLQSTRDKNARIRNGTDFIRDNARPFKTLEKKK